MGRSVQLTDRCRSLAGSYPSVGAGIKTSYQLGEEGNATGILGRLSKFHTGNLHRVTHELVHHSESAKHLGTALQTAAHRETALRSRHQRKQNPELNAEDE